MTAIDDVLRKAWTEPFYIKGDFARLYAQEVAIAASLGLITTRLSEEHHGRQWFVTRKGLESIQHEDPEDRSCALFMW